MGIETIKYLDKKLSEYNNELLSLKDTESINLINKKIKNVYKLRLILLNNIKR